MRLGGFIVRRGADGFVRSRSGNVAMLWALMGGVLVGLVGLTVDFTRAQSIRAQMQNAADGAALVAERSSDMSMANRTAAARAFFDAEVGDMDADIALADVSFEVVELETGGHRVDAGVDMPLSLARLISNSDWRIEVQAEAQASASPPIEVVLALDNTGSMQNDMGTLRDGARTLAEYLLGLDGDSVSVGLVPFVAQVNIGATAPTSWLDTTATNPHHGEIFEDQYMGWRATTGSACTNATNFPTTYGGFTVRWVRGNASYPSPYNNTGRCYAFSPSAVNIFSLYANLPSSGAWGGCVESRPPPYDINDTAPSSGTPATRFVPFFSMDEGGDDTDANNWVTSATYDRTDVFGFGGTTFTAAPNVRTLAVYKYRSGVPVSISNSNTMSGHGPNRGCPTPIVALTSSESTVVNAIDNMTYWFGGGTNQIEGLSWAWRVISPGEPYTQGRAYNDPNDPVRKVIVLFTDGDNTSLDSDNAAFESEYSALNYRSLWRSYQSRIIPTITGTSATWTATAIATSPTNWQRSVAGLNTSAAQSNDDDDMVAYMNTRQGALCTAIKAAGVEIYTIGFGLTAGGTADTLLQACATQDGEHFFHADNQSELLDAFEAIGTGIGKLRITQ
jgi:Flp pilus assembly protein TadG